MFTLYVKNFAAPNFFSHTHHIALCLYFTLQLISAITVGRHQAIIRPGYKNTKIYTGCTYNKVGDVSVYIKYTL
jgi:hypothetical protein